MTVTVNSIRFAIPFNQKLTLGKLLSSLVSDIMRMSTLPVIFCSRLSNLSLREFILNLYWIYIRWATTILFRLHFLMEHKLGTLCDSFKELALYSVFIQLPLIFSSKLCKIEHHCNALDIDSTNVFDKMLAPFFFRCNLDPFRHSL